MQKTQKYNLLTLFLLLAVVPLSAQKTYFQQEVNFVISATLDDKTHTVVGQVEMEYINHSPDTLRTIWMHLWPNAFKNRRSAFCRQKLNQGSSKFYFSDEKDLGSLKKLDFTANGQKISWAYDPQNPDIALLTLPAPLPPNGRTKIATPYLLKVPASFSRLGHVGTSYQMTQWFPKPAVYDRKGWHPMPYLDQGEFFSEFGNFDVTITLPDNYVVGATGTLQTASEWDFLAQKVSETKAKLSKGVNTKMDSFPSSSPRMKTLRYTAERVHDFAWFADKRFMVLRDTARLSDGKTVDCWAMFTNKEANLWEKGAFYVRRAVEFYSQHVGEYPYPQATAVHSALSAGGGMEYPMITVIGDSGDAESLDDVITHEVGHNWFYGILATNERDHPYLDEGFNTYYENRYMKTYYGSLDYEALPDWLHNPKKHGSEAELGMLLLARERADTPPDSRSDAFKPLAYGVQVYAKTAFCLNWLEKSLGTPLFDKAMQAYFRQAQFTHPYAEDLQAAWRSVGVEAPWFFEAMRTQQQADPAIVGLKKRSADIWEVELAQRGTLQAPFPVNALQKDSVIKTVWVMPSAKQVEIEAPGADRFVVDAERIMLDLNRQNNEWRTSGVLPWVEPLQISMLAALQNNRRTTLGALPWLGWNNNDKTMIGLAFYNPPLPGQRFQYFLVPGLATNTGELVGLADLRYHLYPGGLFPKLTVGLTAKSFHENFAGSSDTERYTEAFDYDLRFKRLSPMLRLELRSRNATFRHRLQVRALFIGRESPQFELNRQKVWKVETQNGRRDTLFATTFLGKEASTARLYEWRYEGQQRRSPNPFQYALTLEHQRYKDPFDRASKYVRASLEWVQNFYYKPKRSITARFFGGYFLQNSKRNAGTVSNDLARASFALNPQAFNDYRFDQTFLGRNATTGFLSRQVSRTEGGFKSAFGAPFAGVVGNSNNFIVSLNLEADLPQRLPLGLPLKPWFDVGYYDDASPLGEGRPRSEQLLWSGGVMLSFKGIFEIYFPLANSKYLKDRYCEQSGGSNTNAIFCGGNYWKWVSWGLHLPLGGPDKLLESAVR